MDYFIEDTKSKISKTLSDLNDETITEEQRQSLSERFDDLTTMLGIYSRVKETIAARNVSVSMMR